MMIEVTGYDHLTRRESKILIDSDAIRCVLEGCDNLNEIRPTMINFKHLDNANYIFVKESYQQVKKLITGK